MRLLLAFGTLLAAAPLSAQHSPRPAPHPARVVWTSSAVSLPTASDTVRGTPGAGTWIGAGVGAAAGWYLTGAGCALAERVTCGMPQLIGLLLGGLTGAMIGSAFEGDQTPTPLPTQRP